MSLINPGDMPNSGPFANSMCKLDANMRELITGNMRPASTNQQLTCSHLALVLYTPGSDANTQQPTTFHRHDHRPDRAAQAPAWLDA